MPRHPRGVQNWSRTLSFEGVMRRSPPSARGTFGTSCNSPRRARCAAAAASHLSSHPTTHPSRRHECRHYLPTARCTDQADRERRGRGGPGVQLRIPLLDSHRGARQGAARGPQRGQRERHALGAAGTRLQAVRRRPPGAPSSALHGARDWQSTQGAAGRAGREAGQAAAAHHRPAWAMPNPCP